MLPNGDVLVAETNAPPRPQDGGGIKGWFVKRFTKKGGGAVPSAGSWNRKPPSRYRVIFVPFDGGIPAGAPIDVLTGFLSPKGEALGRPVGVAIDNRGALLVADDVGNTIWRVTGYVVDVAPARRR